VTSKPTPQRRRYPWEQPATSKPAAVPEPPRPALSPAPVPRLALSIKELSAALGVSMATIQSWQRAGIAPPSFVLPATKRRLFPVASVERWLLDRAAEADVDHQGRTDGEGTP